MADTKRLDRSIKQLRRVLTLETRTGYLGDGTGETHDRRNPGQYYVRFHQAGGGFTAPVSLPLAPNANLPSTDGLAIDVAYDKAGRMVILGANAPAMAGSGQNPLQLNPLDPQASSLINQTQLTTFYATRHADINNKPFYAVVLPGFFYIGKTLTYFPGNEIDLSGLQPAATEHVYVTVFLKTDGTLEAFASTAINVADPLSLADIQETINAATAGSQPVWTWEITGADTSLTVDPTRQVDLRAIVGGGVLGSGSGTVTSVAMTVPSGFSVGGSPIISSGILAISLDSQAANKVLASPSGGAGSPTFRVLAGADIPDLTQYPLLAGRAGGQTLYGGTAPSENLALNSTLHATKGSVLIAGSLIQANEATGVVTIGSALTPINPVIINSTLATTNDVNQAALLINMTANPAAAGDTTGFYRGFWVKVASAGIHPFNALLGFQLRVEHATSQALAGLTGGQSRILNTSSATIVTAMGFRIMDATNSGGGTINTLSGLYIDNQTAGNTNYAICTNAGSLLFNAGGDASTNFQVQGDMDVNLIFAKASTDRLGVGTAAPNTKQHVLLTDAGTNAIVNVVTVGHDSSGTPAAGYGSGITVEGKSSTTASQSMGRLTYEWVVATHASRTARGKLTAFDAAGEREALRFEASGAAPMLGFFGAGAVIQPTTAGAAASFTANTSGIANDTATWDGYTIGQVMKALRNEGLLA